MNDYFFFFSLLVSFMYADVEMKTECVPLRSCCLSLFVHLSSPFAKECLTFMSNETFLQSCSRKGMMLFCSTQLSNVCRSFFFGNLFFFFQAFFDVLGKDGVCIKALRLANNPGNAYV